MMCVTIKDVAGVLKEIHEDVLGFTVLHRDHKGEIRLNTTLCPLDKGTENFMKENRILYS